MNKQTIKFRYIFILEPAYNYDFSSLYPMAEQVRFLTNGREASLVETASKISDNLTLFDTDKDALVAAGRVYPCIILGGLLRDKGVEKCHIGRWNKKENYYTWEVLHL